MKIFTYEKEFKTNASNSKLYNALIVSMNNIGVTIFKIDKHEFYPQGMTAFIILGESHVALHSFPEENLVWIQLSVCTCNIDHELFFKKFQELIMF